MPFTLVEKEGDLFQCKDSASLAHCVSEDLAMSKGIAVKFKTKFGNVEELRKQGATVGQFAVLKNNGRYIYYLVTKDKFSNKPNEIALKYCLREMRDHIQQNGVTELCMPRIGCGLDELKWDKVKQIIKEVLKDCSLNVTIYYQENSQSFKFKEVNGDLFQCPVSCSLAHCISEDLVMKKGIAATFLKKFGNPDELKGQNCIMGQSAILEDQGRYIYYLMAKKTFCDKISETSLSQAMLFMRDHCKSHGVKQLAMPKIGSGLNRLPWEIVKKIIIKIFREIDIEVIIYNGSQ